MQLKSAYEALGLLSKASMRTLVTPFFRSPISLAASRERSMILPLIYGPRSLILTRTFLPLARLVTLTMEPNGNDLCAAVSSCMLKRSPLAVRRP